jgi:hypothetical protein
MNDTNFQASMGFQMDMSMNMINIGPTPASGLNGVLFGSPSKSPWESRHLHKPGREQPLRQGN